MARRLLSIDSLGFLVMGLITAALYLAAIRPAMDLSAREQRIKEQISGLRTTLLSHRQQGARMQVLVDEARELAAGQTPLQPGDTLLTRRAELTGLLGDHQLLLDQFETGDQVLADGFTRHTITLRGDGAFPDIVAMLAALHVEFPDTLMVSIEITGQPLAAESQRRFVLELLWYALSPGDE